MRPKLHSHLVDTSESAIYTVGVTYTYMEIHHMAIAAEVKHQINRSHTRCFACGAENEVGIGLSFTSCGNYQVIGECTIDERYQGYPGVVQGGIVSTILDSAMTNCLFNQGIEAMTVRLNVQFREPVLTGENMVIEATLTAQRGRVYNLKANITQCGKLRASAAGRFMVRDNAL